MWIKNDSIIAKDKPAEGLSGGFLGGSKAPTAAKVAAPVTVDSDAERLAKLQSQKLIAKEEADIESLLLKKANAKKGQEQLEKAGKPDATDVAQNLGSSGINLGIGVSTLLLAALIPPLGIPLTLAAAGFLAKGSFQGLSGVLGAAEVAGGAIEGAAKSAGKTAESLGKAAGAAKDNVVATGKAVGKGAYTVGKGATSAAGATGKAARSLYNKARGKNKNKLEYDSGGDGVFREHENAGKNTGGDGFGFKSDAPTGSPPFSVGGSGSEVTTPSKLLQMVEKGNQDVIDRVRSQDPAIIAIMANTPEDVLKNIYDMSGFDEETRGKINEKVSQKRLENEANKVEEAGKTQKVEGTAKVPRETNGNLSEETANVKAVAREKEVGKGISNKKQGSAPTFVNKSSDSGSRKIS
ncbi:MAG: hypothetical protein PQ613_06690 [Rickettsiales bacterium]|nr:hypothetical protein [Rickettsiales bacterium]